MSKSDDADWKANNLLSYIERYGLRDERLVRLQDWKALRRSHPEQLEQALRKFALSIAPAQLSPKQQKPDGISPADWLISLKPEYACSAIARWEGRHSSKLLKLVSDLYAVCPEFVLDNPWDHNFPTSEPGLLDRLMAGATWAIELVKAAPIEGIAGLDRKASMIGGIPWTCSRYPWPTGDEGPMTPVIQLNMKQLELTLLHEFPEIIVQIWSYGVSDLYTRTIALDHLDGAKAMAEVKTNSNEYIFYDGSENGLIGEIISRGAECFHLISENTLEGLWDWRLSERYSSMPPRRMADIERLIAEIGGEASRLDSMLPRFARRNHFGGWQSPIQTIYEPWQGKKALLEYKSDEWCGLHVLFDGSMQITFDPKDPWAGYEAYASR